MADGAMQRRADLAKVAAIFAVDPAGIGGVVLRALPGPARDRWLNGLRLILPRAMPLLRVPLHISDGRLLGGLDLAATLRSGRPIAECGVLAAAHDGVVLLAMAERVAPATAAQIASVMDAGAVLIQRDGLGLRHPARIGVIALDEGIDEEEFVAGALRDRLAFHIDLSGLLTQEIGESAYTPAQIDVARQRLPRVRSEASIEEALCEAALALGIDSLRAVLLSLRVAKAAAALAGRDHIDEADAILAARLVLISRATQLPACASARPQEADDDSSENDEQDAEPESADPETVEATESVAEEAEHSAGSEPKEEVEADAGKPLAEVMLEAATAAMRSGLLENLKPAGSAGRTRSVGKAGFAVQSAARGRPAGSRRGEPRGGVRLNVIETLRAAAPWQRLRRRETDAEAVTALQRMRIKIRPEDFHITRYKQRSESTAIFVVDASGSAALHRLAEAKGAVELLLADCYVRRDRVAVIAFRGRSAELLLPPTRSLVRAKRCLAGMAGGGGTPLATAIDATLALAGSSRRRGEAPTVVLLTDGRANIARDGSGDRARAESDALAAARRARLAGVTALLIDTAPRPQILARRLAEEMRAVYLPLPYADAAALSTAVKAIGNTSQRAH